MLSPRTRTKPTGHEGVSLMNVKSADAESPAGPVVVRVIVPLVSVVAVNGSESTP